MKLNDLAEGETGIVTSMDLEDESMIRLMELRIIEGTEIKLIKYGPFGSPIQIQIYGSSYMFRKNQAEKIGVKYHPQ